jgi:hypothetical protein
LKLERVDLDVRDSSKMSSGVLFIQAQGPALEIIADVDQMYGGADNDIFYMDAAGDAAWRMPAR